MPRRGGPGAKRLEGPGAKRLPEGQHRPCPKGTQGAVFACVDPWPQATLGVDSSPKGCRLARPEGRRLIRRPSNRLPIPVVRPVFRVVRFGHGRTLRLRYERAELRLTLVAGAGVPPAVTRIAGTHLCDSSAFRFQHPTHSGVISSSPIT